MTLYEPKKKKYCKLKECPPLPLIYNKDGSLYKFKGKINGLSVVIEDFEEMKKIISMGYFGKANLSRNYPEFAKTEIIERRVFENRKKYQDRSSGQIRKIVIVPDNEKDNTLDYLTNLKPIFELDKSGIKETVSLGLEEAFFLTSALNCIEISSEGSILTLEQMWGLFQKINKYFVRNYVIYYYYRSRNWVVKPGLKFGGDFLLYKQGPPFYHASYVVVINVVNEKMETVPDLLTCSMENIYLMGLNRLCETAGKELLICELKWPTIQTINYLDLTKFSVREFLMKRWISSQERS